MFFQTQDKHKTKQKKKENMVMLPTSSLHLSELHTAFG